MWILTAWRLLNPLIRKGGLPLLLIGAIVAQGYWGRLQMNALRKDLTESRRQTESIKEALAKANQALVRLDEASKHIPIGETRTMFIEVPKYIGYEKPVPILVTRTEKTVETKIETLTLPPERIKEIIEKSPQSIVATLTALRDIRQGEKFTVTFSQVQPGVWLPLVTSDSPVGIDAKVVTPVDRIPQPIVIPEPRRFNFTLYGGISSQDAVVFGGRLNYRLDRVFGTEGSAECQRATAGASFPYIRCGGVDFRLLGTATF